MQREWWWQGRHTGWSLCDWSHPLEKQRKPAPGSRCGAFILARQEPLLAPGADTLGGGGLL